MKKSDLLKPLLYLTLFSMILIAVVVILTNSKQTAYYKKELIIGVFPRRDIPTTIKMFTPLAQHIEKQTGITTKIETTNSFISFWKKVQEKKYDLVHYNQLHYILSHEKQGYKVIVKNTEFGSKTIRSTIMVRKNSPIKRLTDLKNKNIFFGGGELAFISHIGNRLALRRQGLKDSDYNWRYVKSPLNSIIKVFNKQADAAAVSNISTKIKYVKNEIATNQMSYLYLGPEIPHLPWAIKDDLPEQLIATIKNALTRLDHSKIGKSILNNAGLTALHSATDSEFDIVRKIYREYLATFE